MPPAPTPATRPVTASAAIAETGMPTTSARPIALSTAAGSAWVLREERQDDEDERDQRQPEGDERSGRGGVRAVRRHGDESGQHRPRTRAPTGASPA